MPSRRGLPSGGASNRNICMRGDAPSPGVNMFALSVPLASWPSASSTSPSAPPRPKFAACALPAASVKPLSYQKSCSQLLT